MSVIIKGNINQVQQPSYTFAPNKPIVTTMRETGSRSYIMGRAYSLAGAGFRVDAVQDGDSPVWKLEAKVDGDPTDPNPENLENTHEIRSNILYPDIKTNLVLQGQFTGGAAESISLVEQYANKIKTGEYSYATALASISLDIDTADQAVAIQLLDLYLLGVETFPQHQYVYVHTFNYGTMSSLAIDYSNVGKMFTPAQMTDEEGIPATLALPAGGYWLKMAPEKVVSIGQGESLKYEYWWTQSFSSLLYATV